MLKSTFTYIHQQNVYVSQYLGDLEHFDTQQNYKHTIEHFFQLFDKMPDLVLADKHPGFFSTNFAGQLAEELDIPFKKYQHHIAHFAAILGEHNLIESAEPILGVIWDGIGLGDDGHVWGGEFFIYHKYEFNRYRHFEYFDYILGDKMSREPRLSALAAARGIKVAEKLLKDKFSDLEWKNYRKLLDKEDNLKTSSVGRLFDAAASLLDIKDAATFEGEAPMLFEAKGRAYVDENGGDFSSAYSLNIKGNKIATQPFLQGAIEDLNAGIVVEKNCCKISLLACKGNFQNS